MIYTIKAKSLVLIAISLLVLCGCGKRQDTSESNRTVNFLPNTYIDSLYISYVNSDGLKKVSNANSLLAAIYEEESADSLTQFTTNEDMDIIDANVNYWMSEYFCYSCRFNEAESIGLLALKKAPKVNDESFEIEINSLLGLICQRMGKNEEALGYMQKCYDASLKSGNLEDQSSDLSNLAAIALSLRDPELAKTYIDRAIEVESQLDRDNALAIRYGIASEVYLTLGQLETAEKYAREAYDLDIKGGREGKAAIRLSQLAAVLIAKGDNQQAIEILLQAEPYLVANGNIYSLAVVENQLGTLFLDRGQNALAAEHFKQAYEISKDGGNLIFLQRALNGLASALKDTDIQQAYGYLAQSMEVADSIYQLNSKKELAEIQQKYTESEALRESEHRAYERKVQIYALIILLSVLVLVISVMLLVIRHKNKEQNVMKSIEKMRSNFFTNVTHEFRTPITVIMGLSQDISRDASTSLDVKAAADVIESQGQGLLELVNQLLDIGKVQSEIGTPDWRRGNVVSYMHMIAEKYMHTASHKGVDLVFSPSENVIEMDFIPQYLHKILHNLISNSLKFTPKGGRIYISTNVKDNKLNLRIADTGTGISKADLPYVFKLYYQGENSGVGMGSGIGLSLVEQMVKAMDGEISVKSVKDKGTIFTISIPLIHKGLTNSLLAEYPEIYDSSETSEYSDNSETSETSENSDITETSETSEPIVLIVEDHPEVATYIGSHLSQYNVQFARNGREGLAKAQELIPEVIVTDMMMPEMDGLEMTKEIRTNDAINHIPIIMITAKAEDADKVRALEVGVDAYLVKPFNRDELEVRVSQLIMQRRILCEKYQRAVDAGGVDDELPISDRQFISNMVGIVYGMISKGEPTDLEVVANKMNMSSRTFSRKMQALTGDSPLLYINKVKVSKAKKIIDSDSKIPLSEVAYQCGFEDPNYFSRIFKQIEGVSPTAYRRRMK